MLRRLRIAAALMALAGAPLEATVQTPIGVSYQPALYWALPYYVATEKGWWKEVGLQPNFSVFPAGAPQVAAAQAKSWGGGGTRSGAARARAGRAGPPTLRLTHHKAKGKREMGRGEKNERVQGKPPRPQRPRTPRPT